MQQVRIQKKFWDKMISGENKHCIVELSTGLESGTYEFLREDETYEAGNNGFWVNYNEKVLGTATLKAVDTNVDIECEAEDGMCACWLRLKEGVTNISFDTYSFIKENYIDKNIDFVVYEISDKKTGGSNETN